MISGQAVSRMWWIRACLVALTLVSAACASAPADPDALIADPYEQTNRDIHAFNKGVDQVLLKPVSEVYDFATPALVKHLIANEVRYLQLPGIFINRLLQGDIEAAGAALGRFSLNTTLGAVGLLDPATEFGLPHEPTDFGVTLAVWGADEGIYLELPFFGPATSRHAVGRVVNFVLDPGFLVTAGVIDLSGVLSAAATARTPVEVVNARHENAELINEVLYESEDSYITARTGYVQFRRRFVGGQDSTEALPDIFEE
ncbi:MAG: VacJ family lipoprotein [Pseudomonadota bacterium]